MVQKSYDLDLSIVISLFNENESLPELVEWIEKVMDTNAYRYEIIMVDDGSTDGNRNCRTTGYDTGNERNF